MFLVKLFVTHVSFFIFIKKLGLDLNMPTHLYSMNKAFQKWFEYLLVVVFIHPTMTMRNPKSFFSYNLGHACKTTLSYIWEGNLLRNITKNTRQFNKIHPFEIENSNMDGLFVDVNGSIRVITFFNDSISISGLWGQRSIDVEICGLGCGYSLGVKPNLSLRLVLHPILECYKQSNLNNFFAMVIILVSKLRSF